MWKKIQLILLLLFSLIINGQKLNLDNYKYIIVADKFDFVKKVDQYQTSSLTKFLFKKKGFQVFLSNEKLPKELINNKCLALFVSVNNESTMFSIKNSIEIKDCFNKSIYTSKVGKSIFKEYKKGYQDAIRKAFNSMTDFIYSYNELSKLNRVLENNEELKEIVKNTNIIIPVNSNKLKTNIKNKPKTLKAIGFTNGYNLYKDDKNLVFKILKTELTDIFIIEGKNGILYKKKNVWRAEYYKNGSLISENFALKL